MLLYIQQSFTRGVEKMRTIETTVFTFDELSEEVQEKVLDKYRDWNVDHDWWEFTYDHVKEIAEKIGIDISQISFSGFFSQGDGARFEGNYQYKQIDTSDEDLVYQIENNSDLKRIVNTLDTIQKFYFYGIQASISFMNYPRYEHSGCMNVNVDLDSDVEYDHPELEITPEHEEAMVECMRAYADYIYDRLYKEYEFLTSDESVKESIKANEFEFTAYGTLS
jgi:hypothetical protein